MKRFSFEGRSWGMTVERGVFLIPPSFLAKRGRPNEDGMKKVEWFSYGEILGKSRGNLGEILVKSRRSGGEI